MKKLGLFAKFSIITIGIVCVVALMTHTYFSKQEHALLEMRLREKVNFINKFYAFLIADSLQRNDDVTLLQVINALEEDQEITSVIVVDQKQEIRYHIDPQRVGTVLEDNQVADTLKTGDALIATIRNTGGAGTELIAPLKIQGRTAPIGAVRIEMTNRIIDTQISNTESTYFTVFLGLLAFALGIMNVAVQRYVQSPLRMLHRSIVAINPLMPEAMLPESSDVFGQINVDLNDLVLRFKAEWQGQQTHTGEQAEQEKNWVQLFARSFLPDMRLLVADKDNRLISDSGNGAGLLEGSDHLMDLITDTNFANLVNSALQKEGDVVRGPVQFEDKMYEATVLSIPGNQSLLVKTLIALKPGAS